MNKKVFCTLAILIQCIFGTTQAEDYALSLNNQKRLDANSNKEITNGYALVEQQGGAPALKLYGKEFTPYISRVLINSTRRRELLNFNLNLLTGSSLLIKCQLLHFFIRQVETAV